ncbi:MAG TPA: RagB/SusD family nutrient uptake outer membrane protein [Flavobacteriales bacterium]
MKNYSLYKILLVVVLFVPTTACEKMLTVQGENQITDLNMLLETPQDAQNVLNGAYDVLANVFNGRIQNLNELLSSNTAPPNNHADLSAVYTRSTNTVNSTVNGIYQDLYLAIARANLLLANASSIAGISDSELKRIEAESKFIRSLAHFWVLKTWAQPWGYTADNSHLGIVLRTEATQLPKARSTVKECYDFIQNDLIEAINDLPESNGYYADKYAAAALLAYTYFMQNNYERTVYYCNMVINSGKYELDDTNDTFHALSLFEHDSPNPEFIFGSNSINTPDLQDSRNGGFTGMYRSYSISGATLSMSEEAYNLLAQTPSDLRNEWIVQANGQYQLTRFGTAETNAMNLNYFDLPILRLTVFKLIRAEALASMGADLQTAITDINDIRNRAFIAATNQVPNTATAEELVQLAREEFRKETLGEGLYVDQQKRRGVLGENVMIRNAPWNCDGMALQFPLSENTGANFIFNPRGGCN